MVSAKCAYNKEWEFYQQLLKILFQFKNLL